MVRRRQRKEEADVEYMLLIYSDPTGFEALSEPAIPRLRIRVGRDVGQVRADVL